MLHQNCTGWGVGGAGGVFFAADFFTAAVWCVPFSGTVGLFNKNYKRKKIKQIANSPSHPDKRSDQLSARGRGGKAHAVSAGVRLVDTAERLILSTLELDP